MPTGDENAQRDALATTRSLAALELIHAELSRSTHNWSTIRVLAARLLEISDRMERGLEPNGD